MSKTNDTHDAQAGASLLSGLVRGAIRQRVLVILAALAVMTWGVSSFLNLPIEAYPDVMATQVQVITQWPGHAAEEVEKIVTVPLETSLNGVPHLSSIRSRSMFGLSVVYLVFDDGVDDYFARQQVMERVAGADIPSTVQPSLDPLSSATGEIFRYTLVGAPLTELRSIEDWTLEREFKAISGVADVSSFGGTIKQYQVIVHPEKLKAWNVTLKNVSDALGSANANAGGSTIERGSEEFVVRGLGLLKDEHDIERVVIAETNGTPVTIGDVADVRIGYQERLGQVGWRPGPGETLGGLGNETDTDDAVEGTILLRRGEAPDPVLEAIHKKIADLNSGRLPKGVQIVPFIDRSTLVHTTTHTVEHNLIEGICLVVAILFLFLGNVRAAIIVAVTIPVALLFAFGCMGVVHVPANLLSLGAVDFGIIVNGSVILVEGVYARLAQRSTVDPQGETITQAILSAIKTVESEIVVTTLIIILGYLPLFTMQSVEKKMFSPMAYTIAFALLGSLLMALFVAPILCLLFLRGRIRGGEARWMQSLKSGYRKALGSAIAYPLPTVVAGAALFLFSMVLAPSLGTEFLPHLDEGNLWIRASMPSTISYSEAAALMPRFRAIFAHYQPVRLVVSQLGRPDDGTDATGFYNAEFLVDLKSYDQWQGYKTKAALVDAMNRELNEIPGVSFNFSQNIEDNVEEAVTGVKGELAVKVFGDDLDVLEKKAAEIQTVLASVPGVVDLDTFSETGEPQVQIDVDRARCARYGLNVQDVQDVIETAVGGKTVSQLLEGERKFGILVRLASEDRRNVHAISDIEISTPDGLRVPLSAVATVTTTRGASFVYREGNRRFIAIKFGVRGRDIGGAVAEAQAKVAKAISIPSGYYTVWGGEFESMQRAEARLALIVPITLGLIWLILFMLFNSPMRATLVMLNVPLALIGGIVALYLAHMHLSVAAAVGFIALFGVAVQNGVIMVSHFDHLRREGIPPGEAVLVGAVDRLRPVLATAVLASIGLVPAALSTGIGSDTQKPLAVVIIGGLISATVLTLFVVPVLYTLLLGRQAMKPIGSGSDEI